MDAYAAHIERDGTVLIKNVIPADDDEHAAQNIVKVLWMHDRLQVFPGDVIEVLRLTQNGEPMVYINTDKQDGEEDVSEADFAIHKKVFGVERFGEGNRKVRVVPHA